MKTKVMLFVCMKSVTTHFFEIKEIKEIKKIKGIKKINCLANFDKELFSLHEFSQIHTRIKANFSVNSCLNLCKFKMNNSSNVVFY